MKPKYSYGYSCGMLVLAMTFLSACSVVSPAPEVEFYVLSAPVEQARPVSMEQLGPRVGIMPVILPDYLQRPQMVLREDNSVGIHVEDFRRWGEKLDSGMARVLGIAMTTHLRPVGGMALPLRTGSPVDLRLQLEVRSFEGRPGGQVRLEAAWTIQNNQQALREGFFSRQSNAGADIASLVRAQSSLVEQLGAELAEIVCML